MKREGFGHPKLRLAARDLRLPMCTIYGIMESLWYATAVRFPRGDIGRLTDEEIGAEIDGLELLEINGAQLVEVLVARRLIDRHPEHRLVVHDWPEHADSHVHAYLAKRVITFADGSLPRLPHDLFNAATRERIRAQYEAKAAEGRRNPSLDHPADAPQEAAEVPDESQLGPDRSGTSPDFPGTSPEPVPAMPVPVPVNTYSPAAPADVLKPPADGDPPEKPPPEQPAGPKRSWITPYADAWAQRTGGEMPIEPALKPLGKLRKKHGDETVLPAWARYLAETEVRWLSVPTFAAKFGLWSGTAPPPRQARQEGFVG